MSSKKAKATRRRMISCFAQIVQEHISGWKIEQIAAGEKVKARKFSYSSQVYLLMLSQFLHLFSLNEIVDVSKIAVFAGVREDVPEVCGIAEWRFYGQTRGESSQAAKNTIFLSC